MIVRIREEAWKRKRERDVGEKTVQDLDTLPATGRGNKQFATETAERTGQSRSKIYQDLKRAR
ncbi:MULTISPECIES: hypothetical protein [unclassified Chelatococcus]|uniref:hypothetical protein n=1 Tax=unclassified Chelatococcus TaxID=2638111 RepID=UPI001BCB5A24|nr:MULTISPECIES: hypothetical protein [unclassified Chelatococcus]MBS7696228.1 hypothetical protein [Chelatococcus sp. YT9]MBX3557745.1 hypothetical protein [Chelatococcus sp.]